MGEPGSMVEERTLTCIWEGTHLGRKSSMYSLWWRACLPCTFCGSVDWGCDLMLSIQILLWIVAEVLQVSFYERVHRWALKGAEWSESYWGKVLWAWWKAGILGSMDMGCAGKGEGEQGWKIRSVSFKRKCQNFKMYLLIQKTSPWENYS